MYIGYCQICYKCSNGMKFGRETHKVIGIGECIS